MHDTARETGRRILETYWQPEWRMILDFGSMNVNGTLREFCPQGATWIGVDLAPGLDVDRVVTAGEPLPFPAETFDMIVSTSVFEHDPCFWETFVELCRVTKPGGVIYINAPSNGKVHRHPMDCWRFYPDAAEGLRLWAERMGLGMEIVETEVCPEGGEGWADFVAVFRRLG